MVAAGGPPTPSGTPEELLRALDPDQQFFARTLLGPVVALAGAGTGKTRAITHRIAYGVRTGVYTPNRVMALTFTARSAGELRSRLRDLGAGSVAARTFHAAALSQLGYFWPQVTGSDSPRVLEGKARSLAEAAAVAKIRVDTATLRDLAAEIEWRKVSMLTIDDYEKKLFMSRPTPGALTIEQTIELHHRYEKVKSDNHRVDFEDVLLVTAGMIENEPSVAMQVHNQYRFFVVDEYQDVSPLQNHLLSLWLGGRRELCVVGDASQTIYSFAGAKADFLLNFARQYPDAKEFRLEHNYRSDEHIIKLANSLMHSRSGALELRAKRPRAENTPEIEPRVYSDDRAEAVGVAQLIAAQIADGRPANSIAILYRINGQAAMLEAALADAGVSYQVRGATRFFEQPQVKKAIMQLRAASVAIADEPLFKSVSDVLRSMGWTQSPPENTGAVRDQWETLNAILRLAESHADDMTFREFTDELMARQASGHEPPSEAVTLATIHAAKGLEWDSVFLVGLSEGLVPISYAKSFEQIDEERRLFYVGITRARDLLSLSSARSAVSRSSRSAEQQPSRFLAEAIGGTRTPRVAR